MLLLVQHADCASPAIFLLHNEVSGIGQGTQSGNVAGGHQGVNQAQQVAKSTARYWICLHSIVCVLIADRQMSVATVW